MSSEAKEIMLNHHSFIRLEITSENHKSSFKRKLITKKGIRSSNHAWFITHSCESLSRQKHSQLHIQSGCYLEKPGWLKEKQMMQEESVFASCEWCLALVTE